MSNQMNNAVISSAVSWMLADERKFYQAKYAASINDDEEELSYVKYRFNIEAKKLENLKKTLAARKAGSTNSIYAEKDEDIENIQSISLQNDPIWLEGIQGAQKNIPKPTVSENKVKPAKYYKIIKDKSGQATETYNIEESERLRSAIVYTNPIYKHLRVGETQKKEIRAFFMHMAENGDKCIAVPFDILLAWLEDGKLTKDQLKRKLKYTRQKFIYDEQYEFVEGEDYRSIDDGSQNGYKRLYIFNVAIKRLCGLIKSRKSIAILEYVIACERELLAAYSKTDAELQETFVRLTEEARSYIKRSASPIFNELVQETKNKAVIKAYNNAMAEVYEKAVAAANAKHLILAYNDINNEEDTSFRIDNPDISEIEMSIGNVIFAKLNWPVLKVAIMAELSMPEEDDLDCDTEIAELDQTIYPAVLNNPNICNKRIFTDEILAKLGIEGPNKEENFAKAERYLANMTEDEKEALYNKPAIIHPFAEFDPFCEREKERMAEDIENIEDKIYAQYSESPTQEDKKERALRIREAKEDRKMQYINDIIYSGKDYKPNKKYMYWIGFQDNSKIPKNATPMFIDPSKSTHKENSWNAIRYQDPRDLVALERELAKNPHNMPDRNLYHVSEVYLRKFFLERYVKRMERAAAAEA